MGELSLMRHAYHAQIYAPSSTTCRLSTLLTCPRTLLYLLCTTPTLLLLLLSTTPLLILTTYSTYCVLRLLFSCVCSLLLPYLY